MTRFDENFIILMADDDPDDFYLTRDAFEETGMLCSLRLVSDGEELMDYLLRRGKFSNGADAPWPSLILLDLNMPRKDGREVLSEIKMNPDLRDIPVLIYTTSGEYEDVRNAYHLGANSYITKPTSFESLVEVMDTLGKYWLNIARLPSKSPETPRVVAELRPNLCKSANPLAICGVRRLAGGSPASCSSSRANTARPLMQCKTL